MTNSKGYRSWWHAICLQGSSEHVVLFLWSMLIWKHTRRVISGCNGASASIVFFTIPFWWLLIETEMFTFWWLLIATLKCLSWLCLINISVSINESGQNVNISVSIIFQFLNFNFEFQFFQLIFNFSIIETIQFQWLKQKTWWSFFFRAMVLCKRACLTSRTTAELVLVLQRYATRCRCDRQQTSQVCKLCILTIEFFILFYKFSKTASYKVNFKCYLAPGMCRRTGTKRHMGSIKMFHYGYKANESGQSMALVGKINNWLDKSNWQHVNLPHLTVWW